MDDVTRKILKEAYEKSQISAFHVDLQEGTYNDPAGDYTVPYQAVKKLSTSLRRHGIPNNWVVTFPEEYQYEGDEEKYIHPLEYEDFEFIGTDRPYIVDPDLKEMILPKFDQDLFHEGQHYDPSQFFKETDLFSGLYYDQCVASAVSGAFKSAHDNGRPLNAIVVVDGTDCNISDQEYLQSLREEIKRQTPEIDLDGGDYYLSLARSDEIVDFFEEIGGGIR